MQRQEYATLKRDEERLTRLVEKLARAAARPKPKPDESQARPRRTHRGNPASAPSGPSRRSRAAALPVAGELVGRFGSPRPESGFSAKRVSSSGRRRAGSPGDRGRARGVRRMAARLRESRHRRPRRGLHESVRQQRRTDPPTGRRVRAGDALAAGRRERGAGGLGAILRAPASGSPDRPVVVGSGPLAACRSTGRPAQSTYHAFFLHRQSQSSSGEPNVHEIQAGRTDRHGRRPGRTASVSTSPRVADQKAPSPVPVEDIRAFTDVFGRIKADYVEPVEDKKLISEAINGMLSGLDPHSAFLDQSTPSRISRPARRASSAAWASRSGWKTVS
jgi:hypothetical protein